MTPLQSGFSQLNCHDVPALYLGQTWGPPLGSAPLGGAALPRPYACGALPMTAPSPVTAPAPLPAGGTAPLSNPGRLFAAELGRGILSRAIVTIRGGKSEEEDLSRQLRSEWLRKTNKAEESPSM